MVGIVTAAVIAYTMCAAPATTAHVQVPAPLQTCTADRGKMAPAPGPLALAASKPEVPFTATASAAPPQSAPQRKSNAVAWGMVIGAAAGVTGGLVQPTHSNGEYVLGNSRAASAAMLGAVGAGIGALIGLAIEKAR